MDNSYKEVRHDKYCVSCVHRDLVGSSEPCNSCIAMPMRYGTEVPYKYKAAPVAKNSAAMVKGKKH
jgi:hypothetical protein